MAKAFPHAEVTGWEPLLDGLALPDPDDRHVLAAAIAGQAQTIVTFNLADFPRDELQPHHVEAVSPDDFLPDQLDLAPAAVIRTLAGRAAKYRKPPMDLNGLLTRLERSAVQDFADEVRRLAF